jgi:integrase
MHFLGQRMTLIPAADGSPLAAYVVLCLLTGIRAEEARALTWQCVNLDEDPARGFLPYGRTSPCGVRSARSATPRPRSPSARAAARTRGRRIAAAQGPAGRQRLLAGELWQDRGLVFSSSGGTPLDAANVRRAFKKITTSAGLGDGWKPLELRISFVSLMSSSGVPVEEIARLVGHTIIRTTEVVYRREGRPVITAGADVMDKIFAGQLPKHLCARMPAKELCRQVTRHRCFKCPGSSASMG